MADLSTPQNIFEDDAKLIELSHRYIEIREELKRKAITNPEDTPTPTRLAKELNLTIEELLELQDFADNFLSEFEQAHISENIIARIDPLTGARIHPTDDLIGGVMP